MLINHDKDTLLPHPPFFARLKNAEEDGRQSNSVSFAEGKVFHCFHSPYEKEEDKGIEEDEESEAKFLKGSEYHIPKNISESFTYFAGDQFYLRCDKKGKNSEIIKMSILEEEDSKQEGDILIWEAKLNEDGETVGIQYLSDHVFLQNRDEFRQFAFNSYLIQEYKDGSKRYRMNGGFVNIFTKDKSVFIPSFEYTLEEGEKRFYYIQIETKIKEESDKNTHRNADLKDIKEYEIGEVTIIDREEEITREESIANEPFIGDPCVVDINSAQAGNYDTERREGKHWIPLPAQGNVDVVFEVFYAPTKTLAADIETVRLGFDAYLNTTVTKKFKISANYINGENACNLPDQLLYTGEFIGVDGEIVIVETSLKHMGKGRYETKTISVPPIKYDIQQGAIFLTEPDPEDRTPCGFEDQVFNVSRQTIARTSFLRLRMLDHQDKIAFA